MLAHLLLLRIGRRACGLLNRLLAQNSLGHLVVTKLLHRETALQVKVRGRPQVECAAKLPLLEVQCLPFRILNERQVELGSIVSI